MVFLTWNSKRHMSVTPYRGRLINWICLNVAVTEISYALQFFERNYYKPYQLLKSRHWCRRLDYLSKDVLDYWFKRDNMRVGRHNYIANNEDHEINFLDVTDHIQVRAQHDLRISLKRYLILILPYRNKKNKLNICNWQTTIYLLHWILWNNH